MSLENRVKRLERAGRVASEGFCQCAIDGPIILFWGDADDDQGDAEQVCEGCGLPVEQITIIWWGNQGVNQE